MKKFLLGTVALAAFAGPAFAADMPARTYTKDPPPYTAPALVYNWTGFYIGGHVGGAFTDGNYRPARERGVLFVDGRLDRILDNAAEACAGASYAAFPELEKMTR